MRLKVAVIAPLSMIWLEINPSHFKDAMASHGSPFLKQWQLVQSTGLIPADAGPFENDMTFTELVLTRDWKRTFIFVVLLLALSVLYVAANSYFRSGNPSGVDAVLAPLSRLYSWNGIAIILVIILAERSTRGLAYLLTFGLARAKGTVKREVRVITPSVISESELREAIQSFCQRIGQPYSLSAEFPEIIIGSYPHEAWVFMETSSSPEVYATEDYELISNALGSTPHSFIGIQFAWTKKASFLANLLAQELKGKWMGVVDYRGAGGGLNSRTPIS